MSLCGSATGHILPRVGAERKLLVLHIVHVKQAKNLGCSVGEWRVHLGVLSVQFNFVIEINGQIGTLYLHIVGLPC